MQSVWLMYIRVRRCTEYSSRVCPSWNKSAGTNSSGSSSKAGMQVDIIAQASYRVQLYPCNRVRSCHHPSVESPTAPPVDRILTPHCPSSFTWHCCVRSVSPRPREVANKHARRPERAAAHYVLIRTVPCLCRTIPHLTVPCPYRTITQLTVT